MQGCGLFCLTGVRSKESGDTCYIIFKKNRLQKENDTCCRINDYGGDIVIRKINICNFKSLLDVELEPGNVNVLIGSNGSGKSAFLEAVGVLSTAMNEGVNSDALLKKGVRLGTPALYKSSFDNLKRLPLTIKVGLSWSEDGGDLWDYHANLDNPINDPKPSWTYHSESLSRNGENILSGGRRKREYKNIEVDKDTSLLFYAKGDKQLNNIKNFLQQFSQYRIYTPNTTTLRGIQPDIYQTDPVGLCGGRLPEAIEEMMDLTNAMFGTLDIYELYELLGWVEDIQIGSPTRDILPKGVPAPLKTIRFTDRYMKKTKEGLRNKLTAYDASEGSLFVLFILVLAMHSQMSNVFGIDNFDQALNPRLAKYTTKIFCEQIIHNNRTAFLTTHNPLVLDGLNLHDERVRLFAFDRNRFGHTVVKRITINEGFDLKKDSLSRLWVTGRLGGVPKI